MEPKIHTLRSLPVKRVNDEGAVDMVRLRLYVIGYELSPKMDMELGVFGDSIEAFRCTTLVDRLLVHEIEFETPQKPKNSCDAPWHDFLRHANAGRLSRLSDVEFLLGTDDTWLNVVRDYSRLALDCARIIPPTSPWAMTKIRVLDTSLAVTDTRIGTFLCSRATAESYPELCPILHSFINKFL